MNKKKTIYFIGAPLSNLDDITIRALNILKESDLVLVESYRNFTTLIKHHKIDIPKEKIYQYDEEKVKIKDLRSVLLQNQTISYISDAGMPVFMDPGKELIHFAEEHQYSVQVIPGISALSVALVYAGIDEAFYFAGFPPRETYLRLPFIKNLEKYNVVVLYETPYRNKKLLSELKKHLSSDWILFAFFDLTGDQEKILKFPLKEFKDIGDAIDKLPAVFVLKKQKKFVKS
ncbi:MAG: SAM-dependent methyltransferase [Leptospiraceae bacterium]|nr:SAM-dependent methyltransferase [Leptospiraceae bacterium]